MIEKTIEYPLAQWNEKDGEIVFRPFIPVTLRTDSEEVRTNGLIDTGSTTSYVDIELAEALGIKLDKYPEVPVGGLGGEGGKGYTVPIKVLVDEFEFEYDAQTIFTKLYSQIMILGHKDFLQHFNVLFQTRDCKFFVTKRPIIEI